MKTASRIYTALILLFLYAPIIVLIVFSFNSTSSTGVFESFSFRWYREVFNSDEMLGALKNTLVVASLSAVISCLIGTCAAVGIFNYRKKWLKTTVLTVTNVPMMNPDIVTGISMMLLFVWSGTLLGIRSTLGFGTLLIAHITFNLPYVILSVLPKLRQLDPHLSEAAQDLGCTPLSAFMRVVIPSIFPGVMSGMMMAFTLSLDDFIISNFTTETYQTLPLYIYSMTKKRVTPDINALSTLIFVSVLALLLLINLSQNRYDKKIRKAKEKFMSTSGK
ncbi:MAG TPA: ABC transporter permease [Bacillota bacterium]|nr:ABC transporter permease [Bacillota bacterium]